MINWKRSKEDEDLVDAIVERAELMGYDTSSGFMDILAVHCNGNPIRLKEWLEADDFNFAHDWHGIRNCVCRDTGGLLNFFSPRFSR